MALWFSVQGKYIWKIGTSKGSGCQITGIIITRFAVKAIKVTFYLPVLICITYCVTLWSHAFCSNVDKIREFIKSVYVDGRYAAVKSSEKPPRDAQAIYT